LSKKIHTFSNDLLGSLDAVALADLIKKKEVSSEEVIKTTIERANKVNPQLNAIVTKSYEQALSNSKNITDGFFNGVPMFFKDLTQIKGLPTRYGSEALQNAAPSNITDSIAKKILSMGFVNMGTTTLPEFGLACATEFPNAPATRNPWNLDYSAGGSSGGAAALVAAGVLPMAHSADGGGSTRIPAACCGAVGLKPTRGRLLLSKIFQNQLVEVAIDGVISRTVRDTARFYYEAEKYYHNKKLPIIGLVDAPTTVKYSIGFEQKAALGETVDAATAKALNKTISFLEGMGHILKPVNLPEAKQLKQDFKDYWALNSFLIKRFGKRVFDKNFDEKKLTKLVKGLADKAAKNMLKAPFLIARLRNSYKMYQQFLQQNKIDMILTPTLSHLTPKIGHFNMNQDCDALFDKMEQWVQYTPFTNATGCPSISLPIGFDNATGLPIGMMFWADWGADKMLLELAYAIEEAKPFKLIFE